MHSGLRIIARVAAVACASVLLFGGSCFAADSTTNTGYNTCLQLSSLEYVAPTEVIRHDLQQSGFYFCAQSAPSQFQCTCPTASVCTERLSQDNRDFGECVCCEQWVYGLVAGLIILTAVAVAFCSYACCCRGRWWCDGYHDPLLPFVPRRSQPVVAAAGAPLPATIFRGYRAADFDIGPITVAATTTPATAPTPTAGNPAASPSATLGGAAVESPTRDSSLRRRRVRSSEAAPQDPPSAFAPPAGAAAANEPADVRFSPPGTGAPDVAEGSGRNETPVDDVSEVEMQEMPPRDGGVQ